MADRLKSRWISAPRRPWPAAVMALGLGIAALTAPAAWANQDAGAAGNGLFAAIRANDIATVKRLVEGGTDPRAKDGKGISAPQLAVRLGHHTIAQFLLAYRRPEALPPLPVAPAPEAVAEAKPAEVPAPAPAAAGEPAAMPDVDHKAADGADKFLPLPPRRTGPQAPMAVAEAPAPLPTPVTPPTVREPEVAAPGSGAKDALPPPGDTPAETAEAVEPATPAEPAKAEADKPGMFARAKSWIGGLFGFGGEEPPMEKPAVAKAPEPAPSEKAPEAKTAAATESAPATDPAALPRDLDKVAAAGDPALAGESRDLPMPDLPKALAEAPVPEDALGKALAVPDDGNPTPGDAAGLDSLFALPGDKKPDAEPPAKVDFASLTPKERLAALDALLARPLVRDAESALEESREVALSHLRAQAARKDAAAKGDRQPALPPEGAKTDTAAVDGPPPGTQMSRRLKIPLPPPDPKGRKSPARDPWFRDVSPDEPDVRAAHAQMRAGPPERGEAPPPVPKVPQLANRAGGETGQDKKVAANMPAPPPIKETAPPPAATTATPATPGGAKSDDPLAALFDVSPKDKATEDAGAKAAGAAKTDDPLAALFDGGPKEPAKAADPLAAELGTQPATEAKDADTTADPLAQALAGLTEAISGPEKGAAAAAPDPIQAAEPPKRTPQEILAALPAGSEVKLDTEGRPKLPAIWTLPVVIPGQEPPVQDLATAYIIPANFRAAFTDKAAKGKAIDVPSGVQSAGAWPVTKIEMADGKVVDSPAEGREEPHAALPGLAPVGDGRPLEGVTLSLGAGTSLYNTFIPETAKGGEGRAADCIEKAGGRTQFCIVELRWPAYLESRFLVSTILYTGTGGVVRFDDGLPTRIHVVYLADGFDEIAGWLVRRFGPPSSTVTRSVAPFGQARRDNPTMVWRTIDRVTQKTVSLEIRKFDDTRDGFPDVRNGVITLYREGTPGIFPQVSIHELMRLKRTG